MVLKEGRDVALFAIGNMVYVAKQVSELLFKEGVNATLINMHTLKPLDVTAIRRVALAHKAIFSLEEHSVIGGLGSAVAEVIAESSERKPFKRFGISDTFIRFVGDQKHHILHRSRHEDRDRLQSQNFRLYQHP